MSPSRPTSLPGSGVSCFNVPMTILEALEWANTKLKGHHDIDAFTGDRLDSPMLDAEILLAHVVGENKTFLFGHLNDEIPDEKSDQFRKMVKRRLAHEPVANIVGKKEFYKRDFKVNRFVLNPRPETELLVENAIKDGLEKSSNGSLIRSEGQTPSEMAEKNIWFADIGTGSGAIAITLAAETKLPVIATDISSEALAVARQNAEKHNVTDLIDFQVGDTLRPLVKLFKKLKSVGEALPDHIIICANLPYLTTEQWEKAQIELKEWEPRQALEAGADGLDAYWKLFRELSENRQLLTDNCKLTTVIEIDPHQTEAIKTLIKHYFPSAKPKIKQDLAGLDRIVIVQNL